MKGGGSGIAGTARSLPFPFEEADAKEPYNNIPEHQTEYPGPFDSSSLSSTSPPAEIDSIECCGPC